MTNVRKCATPDCERLRETGERGTYSYCAPCKAERSRQIRHRDKGPEVIEMRQCAGPGCREIFRWSSWDGRDGKFHAPRCKRAFEKKAKADARAAEANEWREAPARLCPRCGVVKAKEDFHVSAHRGSPCKDCQREANREQYEKDPERFRAGKRTSSRKIRMARYHYWDGQVERPMTEEDFDREFLAQQGRCKIAACGFEFTNRAPDIDHDHETQRFRGLLCHSCNLSIHNGRSPAWYIAVAAYLERAEVRP